MEIGYYLKKVGLACVVEIPIKQGIKKEYKVWKYTVLNDLFNTNPLLDTLPMYLYSKISIRWIQHLMLDIRYRNNKAKYKRFIMKVRKLFLIKEFKQEENEIARIDTIKKQREKDRILFCIIEKHNKRLIDSNYKDGTFVGCFYDIPKLLDSYLESLTIEQIKNLK